MLQMFKSDIKGLKKAYRVYMTGKPSTGNLPPGLAKPAQRALNEAGISNLK